MSLTGAVRSDRDAIRGDRPARDGSGAGRAAAAHAVGRFADVRHQLAIGPLSSAYASISTSFETPTTTELANSPTGVGGLNPDLKPQRGVSYEAGSRARTRAASVTTLALFTILTEDELIPFQVPGAAAGRSYFRTPARPRGKGLEVGLSGDGRSGFVRRDGHVAAAMCTTTSSCAGTSFEDNRVPGVAPVTVNAFASIQPKLGPGRRRADARGQAGREQRQHRVG